MGPEDKEVNEYNETQQYISDICDTIKTILIEKNKRYGNSALSPINCFSKLSSQNSIMVRADDKISRIKNRQEDEIRNNDLIDLCGYIILLLIAKKADPQQLLCLID